jgi:acyl-CoA thioester hydrolase
VPFTARWRVRSYELDANDHVNNAVYLAYAEEIATLHAEALGFGRTWTRAQGGGWVVHTHQITYVRPAAYGDELEVTTRITDLRGARAVRRTEITRAGGDLLAEVTTEWVWVRAADGRPTRAPAELVAAFSVLPKS